MTSTITEWARTWAVSDAALADLQARMGLLDHRPAPSLGGSSEAAVQAGVRVEASRLGMRVWRNNVGVVSDPANNVHIRYGLANDSKAVNEKIKSGDLIGIRPRLIQPQDVGHLIGQFVSFECKESAWFYSPNRNDPREKAQFAWAALITSLGGDARFVNGPGQI